MIDQECKYCDEPATGYGLYDGLLCPAHVEEAIMEERADARWERMRDGW